MKRDMAAARRKVADESCCRICGSTYRVEAAHILSRAQVRPGVGEDPLNIVPLCGGPDGCHARYDSHTLELLGALTLPEQAYVVGLIGIARAYRLTTHCRVGTTAVRDVNARAV